MSSSSSQSSSSDGNAFGYNPSLAAGITFLVLFFLSSCTHLFQAIRYKTIWQGLFVVGTGAECLGCIARTSGAVNPDSTELSARQIALLIFGSLPIFFADNGCHTNSSIAPAGAMAGVYIILFRMIPIICKETCPFPAKASLWTCLGVDFVSLVLQSLAEASLAKHSAALSTPNQAYIQRSLAFSSNSHPLSFIRSS